MLSYEDCVALCALTEEEIAAIAAHEHIPAIVAVELGNYLVRSAAGVPRLKSMILDNIAEARAREDWMKAAKLTLVLCHFMKTHPEHGQTCRAGSAGRKE